MRRCHRDARQGAILVCVIACLAVASVLIALSVQSALRGRREARLQLQLRQTELLCEAGVMRAAHRLRTPNAYSGEHWQPDLQLENYHSASVEIQVFPSPEDALQENSGARQVTVTAKLDSYLDSDGPMQRTHHFAIPMPTTSISLETQ